MLAGRKKQKEKIQSAADLVSYRAHTDNISRCHGALRRTTVTLKTNVGVDSSKREKKKKPIIPAGKKGEGIMGEHNNNKKH